MRKNWEVGYTVNLFHGEDKLGVGVITSIVMKINEQAWSSLKQDLKRITRESYPYGHPRTATTDRDKAMSIEARRMMAVAILRRLEQMETSDERTT